MSIKINLFSTVIYCLTKVISSTNSLYCSIVICRFRFDRIDTLTKWKTYLMSSVDDMTYKNAPIASVIKFARRKNSYKICMYCNVTAPKKPSGFFVSNGNLKEAKPMACVHNLVLIERLR